MDYEGNSEGSIYRGIDGNAYQIINGKSVRVSLDKLMVQGFSNAPIDTVINGVTYRTQQGKVYRVNGTNLTEITDQNELLNLDKQYYSQQGSSNNLMVGGVAALLILLILSRG